MFERRRVDSRLAVSSSLKCATVEVLPCMKGLSSEGMDAGEHAFEASWIL